MESGEEKQPHSCYHQCSQTKRTLPACYFLSALAIMLRCHRFYPYHAVFFFLTELKAIRWHALSVVDSRVKSREDENLRWCLRNLSNDSFTIL